MSNITYEVSGGIAVIKFNRPEKLNTLTLSMYGRFGRVFYKSSGRPAGGSSDIDRRGR